jgi:hypothetical protein
MTKTQLDIICEDLRYISGWTPTQQLRKTIAQYLRQYQVANVYWEGNDWQIEMDLERPVIYKLDEHGVWILQETLHVF